MSEEKRDRWDRDFCGCVLDRIFEHPEAARILLDAYFDRVDLDECCWVVLFSTGCTF